ncbi:MAG: LysR family transcriptional regulator [Kangiellaceae bacterium]|nr:LysR family transcriptional regulator [Kangiellaceae bacterium]
MKGLTLNWDDLRYFLALSRLGTVSGAGKELGVKHTTVARRIQAFEQSIGSRLFDRLPNGYAMTHAGKRLLEHALVMEEQAKEVDRKIFGLEAQLKGSLKLTAAHDVLTQLVIPQIGLFKRAYPQINIELSSSSQLADLAAREADIALRFTPNPPDYLIGRNVLPLGIGLYASEKYLEQNPKVDHLILWSMQDLQSDWVRQHFPTATVSMITNDVTTMIASACNHMGVVRVPCYIADRNPSLRRLRLEIAPSTWGVWVLSHVDTRETAKIKACREFLIDIIEQQRSLITGQESTYYSQN